MNSNIKHALLYTGVLLGIGWLVTSGAAAPVAGDKNRLGAQVTHKDAYFIIDGEPVRLTNGVAARAAAPDSAAMLTTRYFGNEALGDINGDGKDDVAFLLTQNGGGSGTFFYLVAAIKKDIGYLGSNAVFLGDRIAPQTIEIRDGNVVVNYAVRADGEPMAAIPTVAKSMVLKYKEAENNFGEVVQDFEGEADPSRMTLNMKNWEWVSGTNGGKPVVLAHPEKFSLIFGKDGNFSATTDCNGAGGSYIANGSTLKFGAMMSTLMYCEGSQEGDFTSLLGETKGFHFTGKGELVLELEGGGVAIFR
jgi:heat shock protein HslJ